MSITYTIDGVAVTLKNMTHQLRPTPLPPREERFPGEQGSYVVDPPQQPDDLVISGDLEATAASRDEALAQLDVDIRALAATRQDGAEHTVVYGLTTWANMTLREFHTDGPIRPSGAPTTQRQRVVWRWRSLFEAITVATP